MIKNFCICMSAVLALSVGSSEHLPNSMPQGYWTNPYVQPPTFVEKIVAKQLRHNRQPKVMKSYALSLLKDHGLSSEFSCLNALWIKESNWTWNSINKSSGAYGIPQAYPARKMASAGSDWKVNPFTQIRWGVAYILRTHKTPCKAWRYSQKHNSY